MALDILWSKKIEQKFEKLIEYLEDEWGTASVRIFVKKVFDFIDVLQEFPTIGTIENSELNIRGFVIMEQITLFYQIRDEKIILLNFYDNRQNPGRRKY